MNHLLSESLYLRADKWFAVTTQWGSVLADTLQEVHISSYLNTCTRMCKFTCVKHMQTCQNILADMPMHPEYAPQKYLPSLSIFFLSFFKSLS